MLLSDLILDKRGSLGKVWLSAHQERRLSKQQALGVDVGESVDAILTESRPMALRVSGQLMLGVVRIYGRKVQYLMDDCRDTRERISMTFRPGAVDLPEDQIRASRNAITFEPVGHIDAVDMFDWSFNMPAPDESARGMHTAPLTQTNLRSREYGAFNFGRPKAPSIFGDGSSRQGSPGESGHLDSQDFEPIDLELGLDDFSMEFGRDAMSERSRSKSTVPQTPSVMRESMELDQPFDGGNAFGDDFAPMDLGLDDLPELEAEQPMVNGAEAERRRASSELSTPPPPDQALSPRVAKRLAEAQGGKPKQKRVRIVRADEELELPDEDFANPQDDSPIIGEENFIPANPEAVRLRDIRDDPVAYFLPMTDTKIFAGPAGLAPELADLFSFPINVLRRVRESEPEERRASKRQRRRRVTGANGADDDSDSDLTELEEGRRESRELSAPAFDGGFDTIDVGGGDMTLDGILSPPPPAQRSPTREASVAVSRLSVPYAADGEHPLALFDPRVFNSQGELETAASQLESTPRGKTQGGDETPGAGGFSKNTAMAMGVLRRELDAIEAETASTEADKKVRFNNVARGASKRAAAGMFFELLVLGTRDCVTLEQKRAFGPIDVRAKDRFWELAQ